MTTKKRTPRAHTRRIGLGTYTARSHSRPGRSRHYVYVNSSGGVTCSCEAYTLGLGKTCWAMKAVAKRLLRSRVEREEVASR
jgi:hypothetical protein